MDSQRTNDPLDLDLDRALTAALAVEPSPQFLARVRMRIAAEPHLPGWSHSMAWLSSLSSLPAGRIPWLVTAGACVVAFAIAGGATYMYQTGFSSPGPSRIVADLSLMLPGIVPGPLALAASRRERPTPELRAAMRSNAEASRAASAHLAQGNYEAVAAAADTFSRNFAAIESFWAAKEVDEATSLARSALQAAANLRTAALSHDDAAIAKAIAEMTAVCGACHLRYREQLADNSYAIKL
jgi:hypothetical protein